MLSTGVCIVKKAYNEIAGKLMILSAVFSVLTVALATLFGTGGGSTAFKIIYIVSSSIPMLAIQIILAYGIIKEKKMIIVACYALSAFGQLTILYNRFVIKSGLTGGFSESKNFETIPSALSDMIFYIAMVLLIMSAMSEIKKNGKIESGKGSLGSAAVVMFVAAAVKLARIIPIAVYADSYSAKELAKLCVCACLLAAAFVVYGIGVRNKNRSFIWMGFAFKTMASVVLMLTGSANVFSSISGTTESVFYYMGEAVFIIYLLEKSQTPQRKKAK